MEENKNFIIENMNEILVDLHKLGVIVYFDNDILRETIITDPRWFNIVFRSIMDFGRKKIQILFESIYEELKFHEIKNKDSCFEKLERILIDLKKGFNPQQFHFEKFWKEHRKNSIVDKIGFHKLLKTLEDIETKLKEEGKGEILEKFKEFDEKEYELSQTIYSINNSSLNLIMSEILGDNTVFGKENKEKRDSLKILMIKFDLILPKLKYKHFNENPQYYLIPFLFPNKKPQRIILNGNVEPKKIKRNFEWKINYQLKFKPSSMWKMLFLKIRKGCIQNEEKQIMKDEIYWLDGFLFHFVEKREEEKEKSILVEMKTFPMKMNNKKQNDEHFEIIEIKIKSNRNPDYLFNSIHKSMIDFVSQWMMNGTSKKIKFKIFKNITE
eukprot:TRINITY_DN17790_c0_g1_i1.p1 TRINITY_DN17790_c0_g1~~TRINITY_DN17790_c0_g1_i1.p1  ORF type:complete len:383 (+),score=112.10 TRINITY_DN17790_c0_g1_i1:98-1246(+)